MTNKDILAKLLATENVTVLHENVPTASFDVQNRVLRLPQWNDMQGYTYDHLVGHEVGHALYTPFEGWHDSVSERGQAFKSFLNVIEDARIEKLVQRKYPGLRASFVKSYQKMFAEGFFGDDKDFESYNLIDRINVLFKCGESFGVQFSEDEQHWVDEIRVAETWEQVVDIAERMYDSELEKAEQEEEQLFDDGLEEADGGDQIEEESDGFGLDESEDEGDEQMELPQPEAKDSSEDLDEMSYAEESIASKTDEELRDNMEALNANDDPYAENIIVGELNAEPYIVGYKSLLDIQYDDMLNQNSYYHSQCFYEKSRRDADTYASELYNKFLANNKKTISYLVKEFEMKKSAAQYARATLAKTGVIDPVKMNNYKFSEDIFRKVSVVPDGKNHGVVMYLDWSGSMYNDLYNTVVQTLNLVHFCRQVNIPYRVYAFTDGFGDHTRQTLVKELAEKVKLGHACVGKYNYALLEWFNNKMTKMQFREASKRLLFIAKNMNWVKHDLRLGGTPLDTTILLAMDIYNKFKKQNRLDIVNTIFLTDGDSHPAEWRKRYKDDNVYSSDMRGRKIRIIDSVTKKQYKNNRAVYAATETLLNIYKDRTGGNAIGYRIVPASKSRFMQEFEDYSGEKWKKMLKENYIGMTARGYSKLFVIRGGKNLQVENGELTVDRGAKKGALTSAFKKAAKGKIQSRTLLNEFIHEVA
jgi:hypothetical protein